MKQYKIRQIVTSKSKKQVDCMGITIPKDIAIMFEGVNFSFQRVNIGSDIGIFMISGCSNNPTQKEVKEYEFLDCRI